MLVVVYVVYCVLCSIGDRPFNYPVLYVWDFLSAGLFSANGDRNDDTLIYYNEVPIQKNERCRRINCRDKASSWKKSSCRMARKKEIEHN